MAHEEILNCRDCMKEFSFSSEERRRFRDRGFEGAPSRCPECRRLKRMLREARGGRRSRPTFPATCSDCGASTEVPFEPKEGHPVYCRGCLGKRRPRSRPGVH